MTTSGLPPGARRPGRTTVSPVYLVGLGVLALVAIGVVILLPERVNNPEEPPVSATLPAAQNLPGPAASAPRAAAPEKTRNPPAAETTKNPDDPARKEAQALLSEALKQQARLENDGAPIWGDASLRPSYADAMEAVNKANALFDREAYAEAARVFRDAISQFEKLTSTKDVRYTRAMDAGASALAVLDGAGATPHFNTALAVRPGDDRAQTGLRRAALAPQVLEKMDAARKLEAAGNIDAALEIYRAAGALDGEYAPARKNIARLEAIVRDRDYRNAVSGALAALERRRFGQAAKSLEAARKIRPDAPEIGEIRDRIRSGRRLAAIESLRTRATAAEGEERWSAALGFYDKVLTIDPAAGFAVQGKAHAARMDKIYGQVQDYLDNPDRLSSAEPLAHARQVLAAANGISGAGPKLRAGAERLGVLISDANTPRPVVLKSDGQTDVVVYRVARFGVLTEHRLTLRPGRYVAVGSRSGYRDVRVEFHVPPGDTETIVVVRCIERI